MKKIAIIAFILMEVLALTACNNQLHQGNNNMQYFFSGEIVKVETEYLLIEVNDIGNTDLLDGTTMEVSTAVASANGCPNFTIGEYAKVLLAENVTDDSSGQLTALSIYKVDETGAVIHE
ncbi:hypothetical protein [Anaerotignum sp.]|uniref:hypothetical protein n=1 Tax=Anaerotignum sp. TaxID=2039241 RepID=UPI003735ACB1